MANIFQKIFLPQYQYMILDFIDRNRKSITYSSSTGQHRVWHNLYTKSDNFTLSATLVKNRKNPDAPAFVNYSFYCLKHEQCDKECCLKCNNGELRGDFADYDQSEYCNKSDDAKFAFRVYSKMLNNYLKNTNKCGLSCHAR